MDNFRASWVNIVLFGQKSAAVDEYRSKQLNVSCSG
jgi:hypothetical protein